MAVSRRRKKGESSRLKRVKAGTTDIIDEVAARSRTLVKRLDKKTHKKVPGIKWRLF